ncbi:hypothetical protein [Pseudomonas sp. HY7a-MNA-CIBAN-0227]|uniref:hypothetical protein n=1 Tax=Pseudomonas sp. HY7a-MNA-CIBAN-0227 TaxID=3140474 RepID=UPI003322FF33
MIIKDFEYYKKELECIIADDIDSLKRDFKMGDFDSIGEFITHRFAGSDVSSSGYAINKAYDTELAVIDDAYIVFYRDANTQYIVGKDGDYLLMHDGVIELVAENNVDNDLYIQACISPEFVENEFFMRAGEIESRVADNFYTVTNGDIKPARKSGYKP